jgi:hypothetical protein
VTAIAEVSRELRDIARAARDASGYFPALYAGVTDDVRAAIGAGHFGDGARMDAFACAFAERYVRPRRALSPAPACWDAAFDVTGDRSLLIIQHLLLGINAHVNFDLPQVVVAIADESGDIQSVRRDFDAVNDILAARQAAVLHSLGTVSRWVNAAAAVGGGRLFNFSLVRARQQAWLAAERMWPLDAAGRAHYVDELDRLVSVLAYLITRPSFPFSVALRGLRLLEQRDPTKVTGALLDAGPGASGYGRT